MRTEDTIEEVAGVVVPPVEWIKDDAPYLTFVFVRNARLFTSPEGVLEIFRRQFDGVYATGHGALNLLTMHSHVIGHHSRIQTLEELIRHIRSHAGIWFATHADVARHIRQEAGLGRADA